MKYTLSILILILVLVSSCSSKSGERAAAKYKRETQVIQKVALSDVITMSPLQGTLYLLQYNESNTYYVTLTGKLNMVQDTVFIYNIRSFKRNKR